MIVGVDAREAATLSLGGAGKRRYVQELARHLPREAPESRFLLYTIDGHEPAERPANVEWRSLDASGLRWHWAAARRARRECDVYFSTASYLTPHLVGRYVQTVFDVIAFKPFAMPHGRTSRIERLTLSGAIRRARAVIAISEATARDLCELFPRVADRVTVTPLAADERFRPDRPADELAAIKAKYALPDSFVLATGTIEPRKNLVRLIEAYRALPPELRGACGLVLAGKKGWRYEPVVEAAEREQGIRHLHFVPDEDLAKLYAAATVFCYPSLYEGFGLPVLEAMQSGIPVITSNVSSLPEVGGDAVRYVDPHDAGELSQALTELLTDEARRAQLRRAGLEQARRFSWERTARQTMEVLRAAG